MRKWSKSGEKKKTTQTAGGYVNPPALPASKPVKMQRWNDGMPWIFVSNGFPPLCELGYVQRRALEISFYEFPAILLKCSDDDSDAPVETLSWTMSVGDPPKLASSSSYANTHGCSDSVSGPKPYFWGFGKWLMMFGRTQTPVSRVKVRCDPPLNLDLHPSWHVLASGSILQHIVCSSHLKARRWLEVAGTSSPYPKGHTSRVWTGGIRGKRICEQLWGEDCCCSGRSGSTMASRRGNVGQSLDTRHTAQLANEGKSSLASTCFYCRWDTRPPDRTPSFCRNLH